VEQVRETVWSPISGLNAFILSIKQALRPKTHRWLKSLKNIHAVNYLTSEDFKVGEKFVFEGEWWMRGEFIGSLKPNSAKACVAVGLEGKNKGKVRRFHPFQTVHRRK
jgi:hypothetical protein